MPNVPQLAARLQVFTEACRQLVPSDPGPGHALEGAEAVPFLIEDRYNLLNGVLEEGKCDPRLTYGRL